MEKKSNFNLAVNDLLGINLGKGSLTSSKEIPIEKERPIAPVIRQKHIERETGGDTVKAGLQTTIISGETVITGDLLSDGSLEILGELKGNINIQGNAKISGKLSGDFSGNTIELTSSTMTGNVKAKSNVVLDKNAQLFGHVSGIDVVCDGKIQGDINAKGSVVLKENATVIGNIKAAYFTVESGVTLKGSIEISTNSSATTLQSGQSKPITYDTDKPKNSL